ncbi:type II toxin-antitoxin system HicB family antitoxin [Methanosarcinales archaeon]|nr:MAG: type II toxin-antitoxin system HicB family antitoxin [Methanosarcinales archaeon]
MFKKIEITIELIPDQEVGGYVAYCPELDITTEGETVEGAISMMKEAAEGYIEIIGVNNIPCFKTREVMVRKPELATNV